MNHEQLLRRQLEQAEARSILAHAYLRRTVIDVSCFSCIVPGWLEWIWIGAGGCALRLADCKRIGQD